MNPYLAGALGALGKLWVEQVAKDMTCAICGNMTLGRLVAYKCCGKFQCANCKSQTVSSKRCCGCGNRAQYSS